MMPDVEHNMDIDENDPKVRSTGNVCATDAVPAHGLGSKRFERFSEWSSLRRAMAHLILKARQRKTEFDSRATYESQKDENGNPDVPTLDATSQATVLIIRTVQNEVFASEISALAKKDKGETESRESIRERRKVLRKSNIYRLDPFLDQEGILRVGGRLHRADLSYKERHPIILPKEHHITKLLIRLYHQNVYHQGRVITHGAIRGAGYWIVGGHRLVSKILNSCVMCRKMRGRSLNQQMADLPTDRVEICPPFTNVGLDVFGPWIIRTRKLRGGASESKRWRLVFTCLSSRAIHIEVLQSMDTRSFINALRRFFAIRGPATLLRSACGTNLTGANTELGRALKEMDCAKVEKYIKEQGCHWKFTPPPSRLAFWRRLGASNRDNSSGIGCNVTEYRQVST